MDEDDILNCDDGNTANISLFAINQIPQQVAVIDADGNLVWVNQAWKVFADENGASPAATGPGQNYLAVCGASEEKGDRYARSAASGIWAVIRNDIPTFTMEYPCHSPGEHRWFTLTVQPLLGLDRKLYLLTHTNITERKLVENEKDQYVGLITHELRTPLSSIMGPLSLLKSGIVSLSESEKVNELLGMAVSNCGRMNALISDILDNEAFIEGKFSVNLESVEFVEFVRSSVEALQGYAIQFKVNLIYETPKGSLWIKGDSGRLEQVLANLVSNAIKFSPEGEVVSVGLSVTDENRVRVTISDKGSGIAPELHGKVFKKFFQTEDSKARGRKGTGLGLFIAKEIIEAHEGRVAFTSLPGQGTSFFFDLPLMNT